MITVIVTTRNRPDFLYRCLLAIRNQTFKEFECIVVGDHCLFAHKVIAHFPVFRLINNWDNNTKNVGAVGKNMGIEAAKYNLICYCDDDNVLLPNHLQVIADNIKDYDFIATRFLEAQYNYSEAITMLDRKIYDPHNATIGHKDCLSICHTKKVWEDAGNWRPWQEVGYNEDGDFMRRLNHISSNSLQLNDITAIYNLNEKNFTEYENDLFRIHKAGETFVYPELIDKWNKEISDAKK